MTRSEHRKAGATFLKRWLPTFLAFPLGGLIAIETIGSLEGPGTAAVGGLIAGAVIGTVQWLALRSEGVGLRWAIATATAVATGTSLASVATDAGTDVADVMLSGLITGAVVGGAQAATLLIAPRVAALWTVLTAVGWSLAWLATSAIIVDIERGYYMFGAGGALVVTALTGLALGRLLRARSVQAETVAPHATVRA